MSIFILNWEYETQTYVRARTKQRANLPEILGDKVIAKNSQMRLF